MMVRIFLVTVLSLFLLQNMVYGLEVVVKEEAMIERVNEVVKVSLEGIEIPSGTKSVTLIDEKGAKIPAQINDLTAIGKGKVLVFIIPAIGADEEKKYKLSFSKEEALESGIKLSVSEAEEEGIEGGIEESMPLGISIVTGGVSFGQSRGQLGSVRPEGESENFIHLFNLLDTCFWDMPGNPIHIGIFHPNISKRHELLPGIYRNFEEFKILAKGPVSVVTLVRAKAGIKNNGEMEGIIVNEYFSGLGRVDSLNRKMTIKDFILPEDVREGMVFHWTFRFPLGDTPFVGETIFPKDPSKEVIEKTPHRSRPFPTYFGMYDSITDHTIGVVARTSPFSGDVIGPYPRRPNEFYDGVRLRPEAIKKGFVQDYEASLFLYKGKPEEMEDIDENLSNPLKVKIVK